MSVNVAIIGAAGYTGEELLALALAHPHIHLACVTSREHAGKRVGDLFPRFSRSSLVFSQPSVDAIRQQAEVVFLCLPHGLAAEFAVPLFEAGLKVIDVSADFRLKSPAIYESYYHAPHPAPTYLAQATYGLPEKNRERIRASRLIACPGCYPTSIILALMPLLKEQLVDPSDIIVSSCSGVTGAGKKLTTDYLFCECNESVRAYSVVGHRHIPEIEQELNECTANGGVMISFVPHLVPMNRGIHSTVVLRPTHAKAGERVHQALSDAYAQEPFVRVLPLGALADTKHVAYTNWCELSCVVDLRTKKIIVTSVVDNLRKGASGQAIQCFNIMQHLDEAAGLA